MSHQYNTIYPIGLFGAWLRSAGVFLRGYEMADPARVRMAIDDAQYNNEIDPREVVEVVPLGVRLSGGDFYGTLHAVVTIAGTETGWSHAQAVSVGGDQAELACPACWPRRCDCDADPSMPACPTCKTNADVTEADCDFGEDHCCHACGENFVAPRKTRPVPPPEPAPDKPKVFGRVETLRPVKGGAS